MSLVRETLILRNKNNEMDFLQKKKKQNNGFSFSMGFFDMK